LEAFHEKRKHQTVSEAKEYIRRFFNRYGRFPAACEMRAFFPLFLERSMQVILDNKINLHLSGDEYEEILKEFLASTPPYSCLDELVAEAQEHETQHKH